MLTSQKRRGSGRLAVVVLGLLALTGCRETAVEIADLTPDGALLPVGASATMIATTDRDAPGTLQIRLHSENNNVVTIDGCSPGAECTVDVSAGSNTATFSITAVGSGTTEVTASIGTGSRSATVEVRPAAFIYDGSVPDTGGMDAGITDAGATDMGADMGATDASGTDSGPPPCFSVFFDGTDDAITTNLVAGANTAVTIETWFRLGAVGMDQTLFESTDGTALRVTAADEVELLLGGVSAAVSTTAPVVTATWYHLAGVYDDSTTTARLFLDGTEVAMTMMAAAFDVSGVASIGATVAGADVLSGVIDSIRVSTSARYSATFLPTNPLGSDADTLLVYELNEGTGTMVTDTSANMQDGTLVNGPSWFPLCAP